MPEILPCCRCSRESLRPLGPTRPQGPILAQERTEAHRRARRLIHHLTSQRRQAEIPHWAREIDHWPIDRVCDWLGDVTDDEIPPTWLRVASQVNLAHLGE